MPPSFLAAATDMNNPSSQGLFMAGPQAFTNALLQQPGTTSALAANQDATTLGAAHMGHAMVKLAAQACPVEQFHELHAAAIALALQRQLRVLQQPKRLASTNRRIIGPLRVERIYNKEDKDHDHD